MKHNWPVTILLIGMFLLAQIIGLFIIKSYIDVPKSVETGQVSWKELPAVGGYGMQRPEATPGVSVATFLSRLLSAQY
jgi:hypothetical protein